MVILRPIVFLIFFFFFVGPAAAQYEGATIGNAVNDTRITSLRNDWNLGFVVYPIIIGNVESLNEAQYHAALDEKLQALDAVRPSFEANNIKIFLKLYSPPGGFG